MDLVFFLLNSRIYFLNLMAVNLGLNSMEALMILGFIKTTENLDYLEHILFSPIAVHL